jgi:hypothetical protein
MRPEAPATIIDLPTASWRANINIYDLLPARSRVIYPQKIPAQYAAARPHPPTRRLQQDRCRLSKKNGSQEPGTCAAPSNWLWIDCESCSQACSWLKKGRSTFPLLTEEPHAGTLSRHTLTGVNGAAALTPVKFCLLGVERIR